MAKDLSILTKLTLSAAGFDKGLEMAKAKTKAFEQGMEKAGGAIKGVFGSLTSIFPPISGEIGGLTQGITGGVSAFKMMIPAIQGVKMAFATTGIGALVIAITTAIAGLVAWLKRTDEGTDLMRKGFDIVKAVIQTVLQKLVALGSAIVKLFKGDFKGSWEDAQKAFTGWGEAIKENVNSAKELNEIQDKLEDFNEDAALRRKNIELEISALELKARDEEAHGAKQRLGFINQIKAKYKELYNLNAEGKLLELQQLEKEIKIHGTNQDLRQKYKELAAEALQLQADYNNSLISMDKLYDKTLKKVREEAELTKKINAEKAHTKGLEGIKPLEASHANINNLLKDRISIIEKLTIKQENLYQAEKKIVDYFKEFKKQITSGEYLTRTFGNAVGQLSDQFVEFAATGKMSFKSLVSSMLGGIRQILVGMLAQAIAGIITKETSSKGIWGLATAAVGVSLLEGLWQSKVPEFATGGLVYNNSVVRVGEYSGVSNNPEVIAPLSKLKSILFEDTNSFPQQIELVARRGDLVATLNYHNKRLKNFG